MERIAAHPRVSMNFVSAGALPLEEKIIFARESGVEAISLMISQLGERLDLGVRAIRAARLRTVSVGGGVQSLIDNEAATLEALKPLIHVAHALECPTAFFVTGPTPPRMPTSEACERLVGTLGPAIDYARSAGVQLGIENGSPATRSIGFVQSLADAIGLSREAGLGLAVELQNCWYERDLERMFRENVDRFLIVQCSDFVVGEEVRLNRRVPGDGSMPLGWMIGRLLDAGYPGYFDLEMLGPAIEEEGYASAISRGIAWLSECLSAYEAPFPS